MHYLQKLLIFILIIKKTVLQDKKINNFSILILNVKLVAEFYFILKS